MEFGDLSADTLRNALKVFLHHAYSSGKVPDNRKHLESLLNNSSPIEEILAQKFVEKLPDGPGGKSGGVALRVGCDWYPHLKMLIQPYGEAPGHVFAVDTHDRFELADDHPEREQILALRRRNEELSKEISQSWDEANIPTQKGLLKRYLRQSKERAAVSSNADGGG